MVVTRSMSTTDPIVTTSMPKTDTMIAEQTEKLMIDELAKTYTIVTRSVPKTDPKIAEQTEKEKMDELAKSKWKLPKDAKIIGQTSSGEIIFKSKPTIETDAMDLFMVDDYLKRYYEKNPRPTSIRILNEVDRVGQCEWHSLSASEKASWIEKVKKKKADEWKAYWDSRAGF